jgi:hypothetical protein
MTVGWSVGKGNLDIALGGLATDTRDMLTRAKQITDYLTTVTDAQLENMGYSTDDVTLIRQVQVDVTTLLGIFTGQATLAAVHDFTFYLSQMYGVK